VSATALALALGSRDVAVALPEAPEEADRRFASSFESDDPVPDWLNTGDTGPGAPRGPCLRPISTRAALVAPVVAVSFAPQSTPSTRRV
jgi:hypothetical protein